MREREDIPAYLRYHQASFLASSVGGKFFGLSQDLSAPMLHARHCIEFPVNLKIVITQCHIKQKDCLSFYLSN